MRIELVTTDEHHGLSITLTVLPCTGDIFKYRQKTYRVSRVEHNVNDSIGVDIYQIQFISLVLERV